MIPAPVVAARNTRNATEVRGLESADGVWGDGGVKVCDDVFSRKMDRRYMEIPIYIYIFLIPYRMIV